MQVRALLDRRPPADVNVTSQPSGRTPLVFCAQTGLADACELLLDRGADVDRRDKLGSTALTMAAEYDAEEVVELLLRRGARHDIGPGDATVAELPLSFAVMHQHIGCAAALLRHGADPDYATLVTPPALVDAVEIGSLELVRLLLDAGADPNVFDVRLLQAPLHSASALGQAAAVALLAAKGASLEARRVDGLRGASVAEHVRSDLISQRSLSGAGARAAAKPGQ